MAEHSKSRIRAEAAFLRTQTKPPAGNPVLTHTEKPVGETRPGYDLVLQAFSGLGRPVADAIRAISVTAFTYYRWRKEFGGLKSDQVKRLKDLEKENERLCKAISDLTLEKLILKEAASGNL